MKIDMSNNERMLSTEGLVDAFELRDADLAQVQGAGGSNHNRRSRHDPDDWRYRQNYWNEPGGWWYPHNYWNESDDWWHQRSHHDHDRWDHR